MCLGGVYLPREIVCVRKIVKPVRSFCLPPGSSPFVRERTAKCESVALLFVCLPPQFSFSRLRTRAHLPSARFQMCHALLRITAQQPDYEKRGRAAW